METFSPTQEPDEGYSEHPLNTSASGSIQDNATTLALRTAELPAWLAAHMPKLTVHEKKHLAMLILNELPTTAIADIVMTQLNPRLYINFVHYLPPEICLKVLGYLDAESLIHVALCCRGWYELASDRKLWEKLYYLEGWMAIRAEIALAEERMNENPTASQMHPQKVKSVEGDEDPAEDDYDMVDADIATGQEPHDTYMSGTSLFGGPQASGSGSSSHSTKKARNMGHLMKSPSPMSRSKDRSGLQTDKGKGRAIAESPSSVPPSAEGNNGQSTLPKSTLWIYDWQDRRYKMNWKYLYSMRRKLESNWERGRYTNFQLPHPDHPDEGHNECIYSLQYNAKYLVSGSRDRTLRIWNLHSRRLVRAPLVGHNGSVLCLQFDSDPEEDLIVSGSSDSDVILWRFSTGEIIQRLKRAHRESVLNVKFDKRILVTCSKDKTIKIFNRQPLRPGDLGYNDPQAVSPVPVNLRNYGYDDSPLNQLAITPPYTMIACLEGHGAAVNAVQICDREIVSASGDRNIRLWDWPNQIVKRTFIGHSKGIACVQYDGRRIVSGSSDNEVKVFDCASGLEVASLRAHSNLVRTVQAGFGDLPYSREEDQLEAKAVDQAYFKALNAGSLEEARPGRRRAYNAGSRRPEDITAYGAKLPPGGGGGPYGRIVSGSYDQSIIIWRRDREGAWKSAHILRQEEGAAAALRRTGTSNSVVPRRPSPAAADVVNTSSHRTDQTLRAQPPAQSASAPPTVHRPPVIYTQVEHPIHATITPQTTASYTQMIDAAVPQGPASLQAALTSFPTMLTYNSHIQAAIDREPDPMVRSQLRQVVSTSLVRAQMAQNRIRESVQQALAAEAASSHTPHTSSQAPPPRPSQPLSLSQLLNGDPPGPSSSSQATNPATIAGGPPPTMTHGIHMHHSHQTLLQQPTPQSFATHVHHHVQSQPLPTSTHGENRDPGHGQAQAQVHAQIQPQPQPQTFTHHQAPGDLQAHAHLAQADASPARIFKLQFDARRIICCSQVSTIVGWDFCNGDAELEEVSRFFGTVE
ncbi:hypothetical protein GQX73_g10115 [Xylaria multiplex]|uniref:F-box domain-containing protein n=1 Tax=Xylaria multiplex TaxID=323545 RepID=A0A7C8IJY0_9PEZI|nr:hypothetical protein GQX73_g10115 [Xylaria multiplex]